MSLELQILGNKKEITRDRTLPVDSTGIRFGCSREQWRQLTLNYFIAIGLGELKHYLSITAQHVRDVCRKYQAQSSMVERLIKFH